MKTIGLVGLYSIDNMGDLVICETSRFLLRDYSGEYDIIDVDAVPRDLAAYRGLHKLNLLVAVLLTRFVIPVVLKIFSSTKLRYRLERFMWRLRLQWHFKEIIPTCDAVIFSGGGFIKFEIQGLNYLLEQVVEICEMHNIPVMFSGVGIEGFDEVDYRCQRLMEALHSTCIRKITTRDFIETLQCQYDIGDPVETALVGDPALWIPECYAATKQATSTIGVNVIRPDIYKDYGNRLSAQGLEEFYVGLLSSLDEKGVDWVLFSNGMIADHQFGLHLLKRMGKPLDMIRSPPQSAAQMVEGISQFKAIFGARMHACIAAYALDIPVVGLIWNQKLARFSELVEQGEMYFKEHEMDVETMTAKLIAPNDQPYDVEIRDDLKTKTKQGLDGFIHALVKG